MRASGRALPTIATVSVIPLPCYRDDNGDLIVVQGGAAVPFQIARVFMVRAPEGAVRGQHAHKQCEQFLICPIGIVDVTCDDGSSTSHHRLDRPDVGLLVPSLIWAEEVYRAPGSLLTVLCDRPYEVDDYLREYSEFRAYRASLQRVDAGR